MTRTNLDKWYALSVIAGNENSTKIRINERLKKAGKLTKDLEFICPEQEVVVQNKEGQNQRKRKMSVPGYMLVRCRNLDESTINLITRVKGVLEFMGGNDHPTTLPLVEVRRLLDDVETGHGKAQTGAAYAYSVGDEIKIIEGPMADFDAIIIELNKDKGTVTVEVEIFGQPTKTQLETTQIKKL